ncbi:MAG: hypothetical protein ACI959_002151, partial [Limisphaerales bacterium]
MSDSSLYRYKARWKTGLLAFGALIVLASVWYTNRMSNKIKAEERRKVEQLASAFEAINAASLEQDFGFMIDFITANKNIPVILVDEQGDVLDFNNLDSNRAEDESYLAHKLSQMRAYADPVIIEVTEDTYQYLYYYHSRIYDEVRWFPLIQLGLVGAFLLASYVVFSTSRRAEQNRVWVGMAKETAHQLGTPISSLVAWVEYLKEQEGNSMDSILDEMSKDVRRLELITERFSKIGSAPDLQPINIEEVLDQSIAYIRNRASTRTVKITFNRAEGVKPVVYLSEPLFAWVVENLLKNALDAMSGSGEIEVTMATRPKEVVIDVSDTGKGIPKSNFNR